MIAQSTGLVLRDMEVYQPRLPAANLGVGFAKGSFAFAEGFDLGADENQASFEFVEQIVVIGGRAVLGDNLDALPALFFRRGFHCLAMIAARVAGARKLRCVSGFPGWCQRIFTVS